MNQHPARVPHVPQLLVSVRNLAEAEAAVAGGCDLLDLKEPANGPLGMADPATIETIARWRRQHAPTVPLSIAAGDVQDWPAHRTVAIPTQPVLVKLGTMGCRTSGAVLDSWFDIQARLQQDWWPEPALQGESPRPIRFSDSRPTAGPHQPGGHPETPPRSGQWVAVAYADSRQAGSPAPSAVLEQLIQHRGRVPELAGLLIDTWHKSAGALFEHFTATELAGLADAAAGAGLWLAIAGRVGQADIPAVRSSRAAIVGIRSAACVEGERSNQVEASRVRQFRERLAELSIGHEHSRR